MRREALKSAIERISSDLTQSGLNKMFEDALAHFRNSASTDSKREQWASHSCISDYLVRTSRYGSAEISVLRSLNMDDFLKATFWEVAFEGTDAGFIYSTNSKINFAVTYLPKIVALLRRELIDEDQMDLEVTKNVSIQRIILVDEAGKLSSPDRIIEMIQSIKSIYSVIAEINNYTGDDLSIVGLDSGSEKSFDFLGVAKLMHELRETLNSVYGMIAFHKHNLTMKNLQIAGETLKVVEQIRNLETDGAITNEEALRLRHSLYSGIEKFASTGAYTPEMEGNIDTPQILMRPQTRLLTGPVEALSESTTERREENVNDAPDLETEQEFSKEELRAAASILRRTKSNKPKKTPTTKIPRAKNN